MAPAPSGFPACGTGGARHAHLPAHGRRSWHRAEALGGCPGVEGPYPSDRLDEWGQSRGLVPQASSCRGPGWRPDGKASPAAGLLVILDIRPRFRDFGAGGIDRTGVQSDDKLYSWLIDRNHISWTCPRLPRHAAGTRNGDRLVHPFFPSLAGSPVTRAYCGVLKLHVTWNDLALRIAHQH